MTVHNGHFYFKVLLNNNVLKMKTFSICVFDMFRVQTTSLPKQSLFTWIPENDCIIHARPVVGDVNFVKKHYVHAHNSVSID